MLVAAAVFSAAASSTGPATAAAGCTQEDMAALVLTLPTAAGAVAVEVAGVPRPGARRLVLSPLRRDPAMPRADLARAYLGSPASGEWLAGTLALDTVTPGHAASGSYAFVRADGRRIAGRFTATWVAGEANCG